MADDREQGRRIARAMMEQDYYNEQSEADDYDENDAFEQSFEGHFADYHFRDEELEYIKDGWGDSESFMVSYGLKFFDDEDCAQAKRTVRDLMAQEDWGYGSGGFAKHRENKRQRLWV